MTRLYRVVVIWIFPGLLLCGGLAAQTGDTVNTNTDSAAGTSAADTAINRSAPVVLRVLPDSVITRLKNDEAFAYANDPAYWRHAKQPAGPVQESWWDRLLGSEGFEVFVLILFAGVLLFAIVRIVASNNLAFFYRSPKRRGGPGTKETPDPMEADLDEELRQFIQAGEYRLAVRLLYLKSLKMLNDRGMIQFHPDATNYEYLRQLGPAPAGARFRDLTTIYERVVYGEFPVGQQLFGRLQQYFEDFYKTVVA